MHFKSEFRSRLVKLYNVLHLLLTLDQTAEGFPHNHGLLPCLFNVYSCLWGKRFADLTKK